MGCKGVSGEVRGAWLTATRSINTTRMQLQESLSPHSLTPLTNPPRISWLSPLSQIVILSGPNLLSSAALFDADLLETWKWLKVTSSSEEDANPVAIAAAMVPQPRNPHLRSFVDSIMA